MNLLPVVTDSPWELTVKDNKSKKIVVKILNSFVPAKGSVSVTVGKHVLDEDKTTMSAQKKRKNSSANNTDINAPLGLQWDSKDHSCSYDALFGILYNIWVQNPDKWYKEFNHINNDYLGILAYGFGKVLEGDASLEVIRNVMRGQLHEIDPQAFPMGANSASVGELAFRMMSSDNVISESQLMCSTCDYAEDEVDHDLGYTLIAKNQTPLSTIK
jgi:hypothetical protein